MNCEAKTPERRAELRQIAIAAGYSVQERSWHGGGKAFDWSPKTPMESRHFNSEDAAWTDVEDRVALRLVEAETLLAARVSVVSQARSEALSDALCLIDTLAGCEMTHEYDSGEVADTVEISQKLCASFGIEVERGWWREIAFIVTGSKA